MLAPSRPSPFAARKLSLWAPLALIAGCTPAPEVFRPDVDLPRLGERAVGAFYLDEVWGLKVASDVHGTTWVLEGELSHDNGWVRDDRSVIDAAVALAARFLAEGLSTGRKKEAVLDDMSFYLLLPRDHPSSIVGDVLASDLVDLIGLERLAFVVSVPSGEQRLVVLALDPERERAEGTVTALDPAKDGDLEELLRRLAELARDVEPAAVDLDGLSIAVEVGRDFVR